MSGLLVVGLDLDTGEVVHVLDRPMREWVAKGHRGDQSLVCFHCFIGDGAPAGTQVGLVPRGRVGGRKCFHFAHPPGQAPWGGHSEETQWHLNAKFTIARWAKTQPGVVDVRQELRTDDGRRRADVHIVFAGGQRVVVEVQGCQITDTEWWRRHQDYREAGIVDVWLWRDWEMMSKATLLHGVPPWIYHPDEQIISIPVSKGEKGQGHRVRLTIQNWGPHFPPHVGDDIEFYDRSLTEFTLAPDGLQLPSDISTWLKAEEQSTREQAAAARISEAKVAEELCRRRRIRWGVA